VKWRTKTGLIAVAILPAAFIGWIWPRESEPTYRGRTLSDWIISESQVSKRVIPEDDGQEEAILHFGTNALPFLMRWLTYVQPRHNLRLFGIPIPFPDRDKKGELANGSFFAFKILGPRAGPALPDLVRLLKGTDGFVAERALAPIDAIGKEGIPALMDYVTNRYAYTCRFRLELIDAMENLGTNGASVVPTLLQCLKSPDSEMAGTAVSLLGNVGPHLASGPQADAVVAALAEATESADKYIRHRAVLGLGQFGASAQSAVPALMRALADPDYQIRDAATNSLNKVAPEILDTKKPEHNP
jgi:HEAT repeat protein